MRLGRAGGLSQEVQQKRKEQKQNQTEQQAEDDPISRRFSTSQGEHPARGGGNNGPFSPLAAEHTPGSKGDPLQEVPSVEGLDYGKLVYNTHNLCCFLLHT